jgi:hypothetical protein
LVSAIEAPASRPAISAAIVDGENPLCSSHRSTPNAGPCATTKSAAARTWFQVPASVRPACQAIRMGYAVSSSCVPNESGAVRPLSSELRGIEPSACCWRSNRNRTVARAVAASPVASRPVNVSYRSRANTSRYEPKNVLAGSPALTAWPHGLAREATTAPGNVLSSLALSTWADV